MKHNPRRSATGASPPRSEQRPRYYNIMALIISIGIAIAFTTTAGRGGPPHLARRTRPPPPEKPIRPSGGRTHGSRGGPPHLAGRARPPPQRPTRPFGGRAHGSSVGEGTISGPQGDGRRLASKGDHSDMQALLLRDGIRISADMLTGESIKLADSIETVTKTQDQNDIAPDKQRLLFVGTALLEPHLPRQVGDRGNWKNLREGR